MAEKKGPDILFPIVLIAGGGFIAWKTGLLEKIGLFKKKEEKPPEEAKTEEKKEVAPSAPSVTPSGVVTIVPMMFGTIEQYPTGELLGGKAFQVAKKDKATTMFVQQKLNELYNAKLTVDGVWGPKTEKAFNEALKKENNSRLALLKKIGLVVKGKKGETIPIASEIDKWDEGESLFESTKEDIRYRP